MNVSDGGVLRPVTRGCEERSVRIQIDGPRSHVEEAGNSTSIYYGDTQCLIPRSTGDTDGLDGVRLNVATDV